MWRLRWLAGYKRFAHNDDHHSVSNASGVEFDGDRFFLKFGLTFGIILEAPQSGMS